ncbi:MAG TPA: IS3 family transposase [Paraburkholderia sp.]|uniref:IS3 family transposase n=1 Tax=Paraburkholderia sp. TaxID=1926495 RepID=UPI002CB18F74|nr:IS3 family transposase [Paraburkholderia sp.]HTR06822.1 IS3 family transposase [Paraburkholderia sp.]
MKAYPEERKEALVRRMMPPENAPVSALARETGITEQTLYTWRRQAKGRGVAVPGDGKNPEGWSSEDKFAVVLEAAALNAAELAEYCRRKGLYPEQIAAWRAACQAANANAAEQAREQRHQSKEDKQRIKQLEKELQRKEKALAEAAALLILRKKGPGGLGGQRGRLINVPDRLLCISLIREAVQSGCRLENACKELGLSLRTFQRWVRDGEAVRADGRTMIERPAPRNRLSEAERQQILEVANSAEFASLPPSQIVPSLADRGVYLASESSFYRVLRSASQQHHRGRARQPSTRVVTSHCATEPNQVWSWDITWLPAAIKGKYYYWYMMLDVFSRKIVGHEVQEVESAELAALLMRRASLAEGLAGRPLVLHSDNGSAMKGATMLATLENLGVMASFSRPRVSNDNPYAEALFRTCKYRPDYPRKAFASLEEARAWTQQFVRWYNHEHKHSGLKFVTPAQRHSGVATAVLAQREAVYAQAKARNPQRWSRSTRNWELKDEVWLNPERMPPVELKQCA